MSISSVSRAAIAIPSAVALLVGWAGGCGSPEEFTETEAHVPGEVRTGTFRLHGTEVELEYEWIDGLMVFEGDIVLDPEDEVVAAPGRASEPLLAARDSRLWPGGIVPYRIAGSVTTPRRVRKAMQEWEDETTIRFVPRTDEAAYLTFVEEPGNTICRANVGYDGGRRYVYLRDTSIRTACNLGVVVHEIGHVLGFWHEHTRSDRDEHVRIIWDNVGLRSAFAKKTTGVRLIGDYDITSTMHYRSYTLSSPSDRPSIERLDGSLILHDWASLSAKDIAATAMLYGGDGAVTEPDAGTEPDGGTEPDAGTIAVPDAGTASEEIALPGAATTADTVGTVDPPTTRGDVSVYPESRVVTGCTAGLTAPSGNPFWLAAVLILLRRAGSLSRIRDERACTDRPRV